MQQQQQQKSKQNIIITTCCPIRTQWASDQPLEQRLMSLNWSKTQFSEDMRPSSRSARVLKIFQFTNFEVCTQFKPRKGVSSWKTEKIIKICKICKKKSISLKQMFGECPNNAFLFNWTQIQFSYSGIVYVSSHLTHAAHVIAAFPSFSLISLLCFGLSASAKFIRYGATNIPMCACFSFDLFSISSIHLWNDHDVAEEC